MVYDFGLSLLRGLYLFNPKLCQSRLDRPWQVRTLYACLTSFTVLDSDRDRSYERPRLNERPVLLRTFFLILAVVQSVIHLYRDYDLVPLAHTGAAVECSRPPRVQLQASIKLIVERSVSLVLITILTAIPVYFLFLRSLAWAVALKIGRSMFTLSKQVKPSGLTGLFSLAIRFLWSALLLAIIWEVSNRAFTIYIAQEPLKKGSPLTTDSKDPNGSLIAGLRAKKETPRSIAFWELRMIADKFPERRATLYLDQDRKGGSTWSQVLDACLSEIQSVSQRIQDSLGPEAAGSSVPEKAPSLPRFGQPLKNDNIFSASPPATTALQIVQNGVDTLAKSYGSPAGPRSASTLPQKLLTEETRQQLWPSNVNGRIWGLVESVCQWRIGQPLRRPFSRRVNAVIFGVPFSNANGIINAVQSICQLVVSSLREDTFGSVQKDIAMIVRVLVTTTSDVQKALDTMPPHWLDVDFDGNRRVPEVDELLDVLRTGLGRILMTFGEYAGNLGIGGEEMRIARGIAASAPEMVQRKG